MLQCQWKLWSPVMRSENKPWGHEIAQVSQYSSKVIVMPMLILLWVVGEEGEWSGKRRKEQEKKGGGERDESNISNEDHNQTYCLTGWIYNYNVALAEIEYYFLSVSSCWEQPCLLEEEAFLSLFTRTPPPVQWLLQCSTTATVISELWLHWNSSDIQEGQKTAASQLFFN